MKKLILIAIIGMLSLSSCHRGGPIREERDTRLYDKTYLIFIKDVVHSDGSETIAYQLYKIDGDYNKFASGTSGITANSINIGQEDENVRKQVFKDFTAQYPDSRIYVNDELWED